MSAEPAWLVMRGGVVHVRVRASPRSARDAVEGPIGDRIVVRVTAPPVEGRANRALCRLIADRAGVAPSQVAIVRGERSREKLVRVDGIDPEGLRGALGPAS